MGIVPDIIQKMPKVEIHLHLEGAFTFEFLFELIHKYGGDPEIKNLKELHNKFVFKILPILLKHGIGKTNFSGLRKISKNLLTKQLKISLFKT